MTQSSLLNIEATIPSHFDDSNINDGNSTDCCLVQIYPTNIVDGLTRIEGSSMCIGREPLNDLALVDGSVSRQHATLERCDGGFLLRDRGSTNGTFVNDTRISEYRLSGGETVRFGSFIFKFLRASGIEAQYHSTVYDAMTRDGLTGAFNKSYLNDSLTHEIARSRRCDRPMSVLLMDIDHFKRINDTYGHLVGDEVLREFAARIRSTKRNDDILCRYGGEEFVVIASETAIEEAFQLAQRCRLAIADKPFQTASGYISVTVSCGIAQQSFGSESQVNADLLEAADIQLYRAKESGRNRVCTASN